MRKGLGQFLLIGVLLVCDLWPAQAQSGKPSLRRAGDDIILKLPSLIPGPCNPRPEWKINRGWPKGVPAQEGVTSFVVRLFQPHGICGRAMVAPPELRIAVDGDVKILVVHFVSDRGGAGETIETQRYDLTAPTR